MTKSMCSITLFLTTQKLFYLSFKPSVQLDNKSLILGWLQKKNLSYCLMLMKTPPYIAS